MRSRRAALLGIALALAAGEARARGEDRCLPPPEPIPVARGTAVGELEAGNTALDAGDPAAALALYREAARLARSAPNARLATRADLNAARAALEAGELAGSEERLRSLEPALATLPASERAGASIHLARSWLRLGELAPERMDAVAQRAAALLEEAREQARERGDPRLESYAQGYLGELYLARGRHEEARALTRRALLGAARADAPDAVYRWHWQLGRIARDQGESEAAIDAYRQALRALAPLRAEVAFASPGAAFGFRSQVEPAYLELVDLLLRSAADAPGETSQALLAEARDTLEALKAAELRNHFRDACLDAQRRATPEEVPGTVVLYPVLLPDRVELIVGTDEGLSLHRAPVDGPTLESAAHRFRQLLTKRTTRQYQPLAEQLYDWLIRPITPVLQGRAIGALVVVPGGALRSIPFAALRDARSGKFLIERVPLAVSPGLTLTDPSPIDRGQVEALVAGISQAVQGFPALANVKSEVAEVRQAFPSVVLMDEAFRRERFEQEVAARPVGVVHVASHGEFSADASESFILAYDGKLPMDRFAAVVAQTRLRSERPLELLVLSACQTATGDDRAALGLAGVALRAGARSALATLWSVNDEAASQLVIRFYEELAKGASRARALQAAQLSVLEQPVFDHPAYWSPFLLISSWL